MPKRWLVFAAVSSDAQAEEEKDSIPSQIRDGQAYVASIGGTVIDTLIVPGFSRDFYTWEEFSKAAAAKPKDPIKDPLRMIVHWDRRDFDGVWIREPSRIGRKMGLVNEFIGKTVDTGAVVYVAMTGQTLTRQDSTISSMIGGYTAEMELKTFVARRKMGMEKRIERGLPAGEVPATHVLIRDDKGQPLRLEVRPQARAFFTYAAQLLVAGHSYGETENIMKAEGWSLPGMKFSVNRLRIAIYKPHFWGHNAQYWRAAEFGNRQRTGLWLIEEGHPVPDGVRIVYNTHDPVLTGDIAQRLKQELRRRADTVTGRARPLSVTPFTGLVVCDECRCAVSRVHVAKRKGYNRYRCTTCFRTRLDITCTQRRSIREEAIIQYVNEQLLTPLENGDYSVLVTTDTTIESQLSDIKASLSQEEDRLSRLIEGQSRARASAFEHYAAQINEVSEYIEHLERSASEMTMQMLDTERQRETLGALIEAAPKPLCERLWQQTTHEINQFLFEAMGNLQMVVRDGEILGLAPRRKGHRRLAPWKTE